MSNAKKCDRCGKLYEQYDGIPLTEGGNKYIAFNVFGWGICKDFYTCPGCMESLVEWIRRGSNEAD